MIEAMGFELVRVKTSGGRVKTLQVMVERGDGSLSVEDCAEVSRTLSTFLDAEDPVQGDYVLEVSSPGIDRPLVKRADFERFAGHEAKIKLRQPLEGRKRFVGALLGVEGDNVTLTLRERSGTPGQTIQRLPLALIEEAKLILTDALIERHLKANKSKPRQSA